MLLVHLTGTNQRVKKFSCNGSGSHGFNALVRGDGRAYTWGYNGRGNLGHNHTNRCQVPDSSSYYRIQ